MIKAVDVGSPAERCGLQVGDRLLTVNGNQILDVLDYQYYTYEKKLVLEVESPEGRLRKVKLRKREGEDLGLEFETYLMDKARSCANRCVFCFVDQMPKGMRKTLYFKDDDARLSFLMGNYITLTNLSDREIQRIIDLKVSPINVSVHTTDPELRDMMLGNRNAHKGIEVMERFSKAGIIMNCQIVCCPGLNDGAQLQHTMEDLAKMHPSVNSVSIVPVGITKYRDGLYQLEAFDRESAAETVRQVEHFGDECIERCGSRIFYCADELYLKAGLELPEDEFYEGYAQLDNGVGMLRLLETEFKAALRIIDEEPKKQPFSVVTGVIAAPYMEKLLLTAKEKCDKIQGKVFPVVNDFFGHTIDVAGLVTGSDLIAQLKGKDLGSRVLIPMNMIRRQERDFLDDVTLEEASRQLGVPIIPIEQDGFDLAEAMFGIEEEKSSGGTDYGETEYYVYNSSNK